MERPTPIKDAAVHRLAQSITQLTLCQVTTSEVDDATKLLEKARQKLQGIQNIPSQRVNDLEAAIRQLRQIGCILDSCTISASYEVTQAQKAILQLHHTAKGASTRPKNSMHRYHHALMTSTISHTMKTSCKSTSTNDAVPEPILMQYDDWEKQFWADSECALSAVASMSFSP